MKTKIILLALSGITLFAVASMLSLRNHHQPATIIHSSIQTFEVTGRVQSLDRSNKTVRIAHEEIPDYMPAMTMPFTVKDVTLLEGLAVDDHVTFALTVSKDDSWISRIVRTSPEAATDAISTSRAATYQEREAERLKIGEKVPDFVLIDQNGKSIHLSDYLGKAVLLTFVYTRCPIPNYCPLMSKNFADLQQRLSKEFAGRYQLLSITMDPAFDRPEVLKLYAGRYGVKGDDWSFATGDAQQIGFVAELMGLYYTPENGLISHDLRTALISQDGRLVQLWKSNVWTPYEVQRMVRETLAFNGVSSRSAARVPQREYGYSSQTR